MKIAVSSVGEGKKDYLDVRFGRCRYFQIYETDDETMISIENKGQIEGSGAGIVAAQQVIDEEVEVMITGHLGPNAYRLFDKTNISVFTSESIPVEAVIALYKEDKLKPLAKAGPAHHGMGVGGRHRGGR